MCAACSANHAKPAKVHLHFKCSLPDEFVLIFKNDAQIFSDFSKMIFWVKE